VRRVRTVRLLPVVPGALAGVLLAAMPLAAQPLAEPDPCAHVHGPTDLAVCWAREAERAEVEMNGVYRTLREKLPGRAAKSLEKAQGLWLEFLEAHLGTLYGVESPRARWGREFPMCLSISRTTLIRGRTRELRRLLEPDEDTICPL
jgi:uncharacterized protein YecT (DUF1311 family)